MKFFNLLTFIFISFGIVSLRAQTPKFNWQFTGPDNTQSYHVLETENNNYLVSGLQSGIETKTPCVILVNREGEELWQTINFGSVDTILHAIELNSSFVVVGNGTSSAFIYKLDKETGDLLQAEEITCTDIIFGCFARYQVGRNALIRSGSDGFYVAGHYYTIGNITETFGEIRRYSEDLTQDMNVASFFGGLNDRVDWAESISDIERASNGDLLFFGINELGVDDCRYDPCTDDVGCSSCNKDVWVMRLANDLDPNLVYIKTLDANACDIFIDACATPDDGFAILGYSTSTLCASFGPGNAASENNPYWYWKLDANAESQLARSVLLNENRFEAKSIIYHNGYLLSGNIGLKLAVLGSYNDQFEQQWSYMHDCAPSGFEYATVSGNDCIYTTGFCNQNKILVSLGSCSFICDEALDLACGKDTTGDNGQEGLENRISDYSSCEEDDGFLQPELIYRISERTFTNENENERIYIAMEELGSEDKAGLDLFVFENCFDGSGESEILCIDKVVRDGSETGPSLIEIANANNASEYFVVVDSRTSSGDFHISVSCLIDCFDGQPLLCDDPRIANNEENGSMQIASYHGPDADDYYANYTGAEYKIPFTAPTSGNYSFRLEDIEGGNLDLFLLNECNPFSCLQTSRNPGNSAEFISIELNADQTVYLCVDGDMGVQSNFTLTVECCSGEPYCGCHKAEAIRCGFDVLGDTRDSDLRNDIYDYSICGSNQRFIQPELVYEITDFVGENGIVSDIYIGFQELGQQFAGHDLFVIENCASGEDGSLSNCVTSRVRMGSDSAVLLEILDPNPESQYYLIVDALTDRGDFRLSVSCTDNCADDDALTCDMDDRWPRNNFTDGSPRISSYAGPGTLDYFDQYTGPEYKVPFTAPVDGNYTFRVSDMQNDLDFFILEDCNPFSTIYHSRNSGTTDEEVSEVSLSANQTIYLSVDARFGIRSNFTIEVECCNALSSELTFVDSSEEMVICKPTQDLVSFTNGLSLADDYVYLLTTEEDQIISEVGSPLDATQLSSGKYRIYGYSYYTEIVFQPGQSIFDVQANVCEIISDNYLTLCIDSVYLTDLGDTIVCQDEPISICDSVLTMAGVHEIVCQSRNGCDSVVRMNIIHENIEVAIDGALSFCPGESTILRAEITPEEDASTYLWSTESTEASIPVNTAGIYWVEVTSSLGCQYRDTVEVTEFSEGAAIALVDDTTICEGTSLTLVSEFSCTNCTCTWTPDTGLDDPGSCNPIATPGSNTNYIVTVHSADGCSFNDTVLVDVDPVLAVKAINDHTSLRQNNEVEINLIENDSFSASSMIETEVLKDRIVPSKIDSDLIDDSQIHDHEISVSADGAYLGTFTFPYIIRDLNCLSQDTGTVEILVIQSDKVCICNPDVDIEGCGIIPNIDEYQNNDITIFDREGNIVHIARPYLNDWTGEHIETGTRVPTGSYYFVLNLHENTSNPTAGEGGIIRGVITIIRR